MKGFNPFMPSVLFMGHRKKSAEPDQWLKEQKQLKYSCLSV